MDTDAIRQMKVYANIAFCGDIAILWICYLGIFQMNKREIDNASKADLSDYFAPYKGFTAEGRSEFIRYLSSKYSTQVYMTDFGRSNEQSIYSFVVSLADYSKIKPARNGFDDIALAFTKLAGETAACDLFDEYIVALGKSDILEPIDVVGLTVAHLAESAA